MSVRSGWCCDEGAVGGGRGEDALLDDPGEAMGDALGGAAIEPRGELVCGISAAATASHEAISGVGACDNGEILMFNMVKR
jgi:hypothetical protein